jgi:hypothetical protein
LLANGLNHGSCIPADIGFHTVGFELPAAGVILKQVVPRGRLNHDEVVVENLLIEVPHRPDRCDFEKVVYLYEVFHGIDLFFWRRRTSCQ